MTYFRRLGVCGERPGATRTEAIERSKMLYFGSKFCSCCFVVLELLFSSARILPCQLGIEQQQLALRSVTFFDAYHNAHRGTVQNTNLAMKHDPLSRAPYMLQQLKLTLWQLPASRTSPQPPPPDWPASRHPSMNGLPRTHERHLRYLTRVQRPCLDL